MGSVVLLAPHADDETLFASHLVQRWKPTVAVCYLPRERVEREARIEELDAALRIQGACEYEGDSHLWLGGYEGEEFRSLREQLAAWRPPMKAHELDPNGEYVDWLFAPMPHEDGHAEHTWVGQAALDVYGPERVLFYQTYTRGNGRTRLGELIKLSPGEVCIKLQAMACYRSQIEHEARRPWFVDLYLDEWVGHVAHP